MNSLSINKNLKNIRRNRILIKMKNSIVLRYLLIIIISMLFKGFYEGFIGGLTITSGISLGTIIIAAIGQLIGKLKLKDFKIEALTFVLSLLILYISIPQTIHLIYILPMTLCIVLVSLLLLLKK